MKKNVVIEVKSGKVWCSSELPKEYLKEIMNALIIIYDLNNEDSIDKIAETKVVNANWEFYLNEDSQIVFEPKLKKRDINRFIKTLGSIVMEGKNE